MAKFNVDNRALIYNTYQMQVSLFLFKNKQILTYF